MSKLITSRFEKSYLESLYKAGLSSAESVNQVEFIVEYGHELGISPVVALNNISLIQDKPVLDATLVTAAAKRAGIDYIVTADYATEIVERKNKEGKVVKVKNIYTEVEVFWEHKFPSGTVVARSAVVRVTLAEMEKQGLLTKSNWKKMPKIMLRVRAITTALRLYAPQVFLGAYEQTEMLDATTDGDYKLETTDDGMVKVLHLIQACLGLMRYCSMPQQEKSPIRDHIPQ